jgi:hypothetical protein
LGGAGGWAGAGGSQGDPGQNLGVGGNSGTIQATLDGSWASSGGLGLYIASSGGNGGGGRDSSALGLSSIAPDGANGGNGNSVNVTLLGTFYGSGGQLNPVTGQPQLGGNLIVSAGGAGGVGGANANDSGDEGGDGGKGGNAGDVTVMLAKGASVYNGASLSAGLWVQSIGGQGGEGGSAKAGGQGGQGGQAGNVTVTLDGSATSSGYMAPAVLAQSLGGAGNNGGNGGGWFGPSAGGGAIGGAAGTVTVNGYEALITAGSSGGENIAPGILAQSIGGGGGTGGHADGWLAVGGNGANAVDGQQVQVSLTYSSISTNALQSDGIAAQSIGGGGGKGGDASGHGAGINMTIGGTAGGGGNGGQVSIYNGTGDVVTTTGDHSVGLLLQSIGGGGGDGGAAYGEVTSSQFGLQISVGGSGGAGGDGGTVSRFVDAYGNQLPTNQGQILTSGANSFGILGQSIGGGGGRGGASTAQAVSYGGDEYPNLSVSVAIGGSGGNGGSGSSVTLFNDGLIATSGQGSLGMLGQSVGGGGGSGGDASATSKASGGSYSLAASIAIAGSGSTGGNGGTVTLQNDGLIITSGESADGMLAQSIGGSGGQGGTGDAKTSGSSDDADIKLSVAVGGAGGGGGSGGGVSANNTAAIITLGDGAIGVGAQSIGGGGGRAGGAGASTSGTYQAQVTVGGNGGSGGTASAVTVNNSGTIVTFGADAPGIHAQSVGGSGGIGGKGSSSLASTKSSGDGGNGSQDSVSSALSAISQNFTANGNGAITDYLGFNNAISAVNSLLGNTAVSAKGNGSLRDEDPVDGLDDVSDSGGTTEDENESQSIKLSVAVGGKGGTGGDGGSVMVTNSAQIGTTGKMSDGIIAQSIGGGGGKGGAATTASSNDTDGGSLAVGGNGNLSGFGGSVAVNNTGGIVTIGPLAAGILAQSVGGGGGIGGISGSSANASGQADSGQFSSLPISIGGSHGASGGGETVSIDSSGAIVTKGHDSIGIIAQSVGGGGGVVKTLATDLDNAGGSQNSQSAKDYSIGLQFGGSDSLGSSGNGGQVTVITNGSGTITTSGDNAYGILAQSIGGGGGLVLGGNPKGSSAADFFGTSTMSGLVDADTTVSVTVGAAISTSGAGAIGVLAQSIGGGGGLAGNTALSNSYQSFGASTSQQSGNGGAIDITTNSGATIFTSGANAPGIFAQSVGGGGGRVTNASGAYIGTAGGTGTGGSINVIVNGTIQATGQGSAGIFAQSEGDSSSNSPISIAVGSTGRIVVGQSDVPTGANGTSAAIYIDHGGMDAAHANTVTNDGLVQTYGSVTNAVAVYSNAGYTSVTNNGTMEGDVLLTNNGGTGCFTNNGTFGSGDSVTVGACGLTNTGTINVGGAGVIGRTTISGNYAQISSGRLVIDADFASGNSDVLTINGAASISGTVEVDASSLRKSTLAVLSSTGPLTIDPGIQTSATHLYSYQISQLGNTLEVTPQAHFVEQANGLGVPEQAVARSLQSTFDSGATLTDGFAALAKINGNSDYASGLRSIAGEGLGAFGAFRINSSRSFSFDLYGGCREMTGDSKVGDSCAWGRVFDRSTDQDARADTVGYHADAYTIEVGGQVSLSDELALVLAAGSESSTMQDDARDSQINGNTAIFGGALNYANGPVQVSGALDGAYGWYRSTRTIAVADDAEAADARPRQWQIGAHLRAGYSVPMSDALYIKPFIDGHAIYVSNNAFTESGTSPFRLAVDGRSNTALLGGVGTEFGAHFTNSSGVMFHPFVSAAVEFDSALDWTTSAHFADQPASAAFAIRTAGPGTLGRLAVGADVANSTHWSFSLMYDPDVGHGYTSQAGSARVSYSF